MEERQYALSVIDSIDTNMVAGTIRKIQEFQAVIQKTLKPSHDFGIIPGTDKPSLLKPGAEKINMMMGISSEYEIMDKVEDYQKGFFAYNIKCTLIKNGLKIVEGVGNCNSKEKKYVTQDPYSITNTILKMAKKRAYIDATLSVASLSDIFTQDIDDPDMRIQTSNVTNQANQGKAAHEQVLTFGKYKGKTLGAIYKEDPGYFDWLRQNNDKMRPFCEEMLKTKNSRDDGDKNFDVDKARGMFYAEIEDLSNQIGVGKDFAADKTKAIVYSKFKVDSLNDLTAEQWASIIKSIDSLKDAATDAINKALEEEIKAEMQSNDVPFDKEDLHFPDEQS